MAKRENSEVVLCVTGIDHDGHLVFQMYDMENDYWYPETILPFSDLRDISMCMSKSVIYVIVPDGTYGEKHGITVSTYDIVTTKVDSIHVSTHNFLGPPVGLYNGYIYFINNDNHFINRYKISDNTVEEKVSRINESYEEQEVVFSNDLLYILGNVDSECKESDCETYNTKTHEMKPIAPFPIPTPSRRAKVLSSRQEAYIAATEFEGKIYAIVDYTLRYLYVYCPVKNQWNIIVNECPPPIGCYGQLKTCDNKLICVDFPGYIHVYHPESNTWNSRSDYNGVLTYVRYLGETDKPAVEGE